MRRIQPGDRALYIRMVQEFYRTDAVDHEIPVENIENTFEELMRGDAYAEAYILEDQGQRPAICFWQKRFLRRQEVRWYGLKKSISGPNIRERALEAGFLKSWTPCLMRAFTAFGLKLKKPIFVRWSFMNARATPGWHMTR